MLDKIIAFILEYKFIFLFYLALIIFLVAVRKKLAYQAKVIILYRTKFGLKIIEKISAKFREWIILSGYLGIGVAFAGMVFISYVLIKNLYDLLFVPATVSGVSLVLPGVNIPGVGVLPFWHWLIAIFVIAVVHEFSHGVVARAHKIEVHNTGLVFLGPIIGAFVEPNEKKMAKEQDVKQYSVLAAGPFSNIILALLAFVLLLLVFTPLQQSMVDPIGFTFDAYYNNTFPIATAGVAPGTLITEVNGITTSTFQQFNEEVACSKPGDQLSIGTSNGTVLLTLAENPSLPGKGFMGITQIRNEVKVKPAYAQGFNYSVYAAVNWICDFLRWLFLLSLGIGLFNLLPLPIVDGGRMVQVFLWKLKGKDKGNKWYGNIGLFFLAVLILCLVLPLIINWF